MTPAQPRISVFPKCYFDELYNGTRDYLDWLRQAATLGAEGVEHYDGFFRGFDDVHLDPVRGVLKETGQISSLLCFSPDFTHPDAAERARQVERQKTAIDLCVSLDIRFCRTLSGQGFPGLTRKDGVERTVEGIRRSLEYAERKGIVLCMENHYKDGNWQYPEFAQPEDIFLEIIGRIESPFFGVQYDPSNAVVGGFDPVPFPGEGQGTASCRCTPRIATWSPARRSTTCARPTARSATPTSCVTARRARGSTITTPSSASWRASVSRLDLGRRRHERPGRVAAVGRVFETQARAVLCDVSRGAEVHMKIRRTCCQPVHVAGSYSGQAGSLSYGFLQPFPLEQFLGILPQLFERLTH